MLECVELKFDDITLGYTAAFDVLVTADKIDAFAVVSGDTNPLHTDEQYAASTLYGARIAHGMLGGALISRLVGMHLPGKYAVFLSQSLVFRKPILVGMAVKVSGTVIQRIEAVRAIKIQTVLTDIATGEVLTDGEALVKLLI